MYIQKSRRNHCSYVELLPKLHVYFQHNLRSCHNDSDYYHNNADEAVRTVKLPLLMTVFTRISAAVVVLNIFAP